MEAFSKFVNLNSYVKSYDILRESNHVVACDSTRRRPRKIEAGKSNENHTNVADSHFSIYFFVSNFSDVDRSDHGSKQGR